MFYQTYLEASFFGGRSSKQRFLFPFPFIYFLFISYSCPIHFLFISQIQFLLISFHFQSFSKKQINNMAVSKDLGLADVLIYAKSN